MIILGIILLIAGFLLKISILWTIGIILIVIGAILALRRFERAVRSAAVGTITRPCHPIPTPAEPRKLPAGRLRGRGSEGFDGRNENRRDSR